jgi:hypothetical protein
MTIPQDSTKNNINTETMMLLLLFFFILFYKFITLRMFDIGGDAINYWFAAKHLLYNIPYGELDHQTARFGFIIPIWISQLIFGTHPAVSLILPNLFLILHIFLIYTIGTHVHSRMVGFISALLFMFCPEIIRFGSQVLTESLGAPLVTASFYFLLKYHDNADNKKKEMLYLSFSAFCLFWAYCAHETNIFFMPCFIMVMLLFKKNIKHICMYSAILFCLFLCETAIFYYYTGDIMARYHAITGHHFTLEKFVPISFWGLFERYTKTHLWWRIPFYIYLIILYPVWKKGNTLIKAIIMPGAIFFLLMLFAVKSINPLIPALAYKESHLISALPFMIFVIAIFIVQAYTFVIKRYAKQKNIQNEPVTGLQFYVQFVSIFCVVILIITASGKLPAKIAPYYNNPLNISDHKFIRFFTYNTLFNNAYNNGLPIGGDYRYTEKDRDLYY